MVVAVGRTRDDLELTADEIRSLGGDVEVSVADVAASDDVQATINDIVRRRGRLDIVVNNAGVYGEPPLLDLDAEMYHAIFDTTCSAPCSSPRRRRG